MPKLVAIVEGQGEVAAVPILLRRMRDEIAPDLVLEIPRPIRRSASKLLNNPQELEKDISLAVLTAGTNGAVLLLLDSEDGPPCKIGPPLSQRAKAARPDAKVFVSLAYREYESWFIASAESLAGKRAFPPNLTCPDQFETKRDAKGWLTDQMLGSAVYRETVDQAALTALFDLALVRGRSKSFARFWRVCSELFSALRSVDA